MAKKKVEETPEAQAEEPQTQPEQAEEPKVDPFEELKKELEAERKARMSLEGDLKDVKGRLTREQQIRAEFERYHTETLPKINKKFEEQWEESPQTAVDVRVADKTQPLARNVENLQAEMAYYSILAETPSYSQYKGRVLELANEHPYLTKDRKGIEQLFKLARSEQLEEQLQKVQTQMKTDQDKSRATTEDSSPRPAQTPKVNLTSAQRYVADKLGVKYEDYVKHMTVTHER